MMRSLYFIAALATVLFSVPAADAAESEWVLTPESRSRLISGVSATGLSVAAPMGFEIELKDGWKTYWRAPGPQGYPPRFSWDTSNNVKSLEVIWPSPKRFSVLGYDSIGYAGSVVLPLSVVFENPSKPAKLVLEVDYLTCNEICVPQLAKHSIVIPAGIPKPTTHAFKIDKARGLAPTPAGAGFSVKKVWLSTYPDKTEIAVEGEAPVKVTQADLFIDELPGYFFGAPRIEQLTGDRFRLTSVAAARPSVAILPGHEAIYTLSLNGQTFQQKVALSAPLKTRTGSQFLIIIAIALLGGLILNFMPCVLPVLAIKLTSVLNHSDRDRRSIRLGFLATSLGILLTFWVLAVGAITLKNFGVAVGWGMQFQEPMFVALMSLIMALFSGNLFGLFEFTAPRSLNRVSEATPSAGVIGAFWTGVLATLLATPCSAPFVGTAIAFALSRGSLEIIAVFTAMAVGLGVPYLLTALFPATVKMLPRPGQWMHVVRIMMGLSVALTGIWLLWILFSQAGFIAVLSAAVASIIIICLARLFQSAVRWWTVGITLSAALAVVWFTATPPRTAEVETANWVKFDMLDVMRRVQAGETLLVDVTADWCVTCKWNKAAVLNRDPVSSILANQVTPIKADWTRPNTDIADYLARYNRFGIPFNIVYGPGAKEGVILPELLSTDVVMKAIMQARGR
jgi:suppressor for copper-sensitivity B